MKRMATAQWNGDLKNGKGTLATGSGVLDGIPYSVPTRFGNEKGTNPEELIGAAHAGCFSMALSAELGNHDVTPDSIETEATVNLDKQSAGWTITAIHLQSTVKAPNADPSAIKDAATAAKVNCPISKLVKGAEVTVDVRTA